MGALEFTGEARGEVVINGRLPAGASICAHEVRFGRDAAFGGPITVRADSEPEAVQGVDAGLINYTLRAEPRCD